MKNKNKTSSRFSYKTDVGLFLIKEAKKSNDITKSESISIPLSQMIKEHERLISILEPHANMDKKVAEELEERKKELKDYKKKLES